MTSLQVIDTGEVVEQMTRVEAERITARIADKLDGIADNIEQVMPLIREALTREAWKPLGYSGATAYVSERFAGAFGRLPAAVRQPIVSELSSAGMSTRAIAPIVGVSNKTVHQDMQVLPRVTPGPTPEFVDTRTGEIRDEPAPKPATVTGMDGKQYTRPMPPETPAPRPDPITTQFTSAIADLNRVLDKLHRIHTNDNFNTNKEKINDRHKADLTRAIEELDQLRSHLAS